MTQSFKGTIQTYTASKTPRIMTRILKTGAYEAHGEIQYSRLEVFVPVPQRTNDVPGIFLSITNPRGRSFLRLTTEEAFQLEEWMCTSLQQAISDLPEAERIANLYRTADKLAHKYSIDELNTQLQDSDEKTPENDLQKDIDIS